MANDYAPIFLDGGGDPSFAQIDTFLRTHFNARAVYFSQDGPVGDLPDGITVNGHLFVHVASCPCPRIQSENERLNQQFNETEGMCPNCVTPWKCNGPHILT